MIYFDLTLSILVSLYCLYHYFKKKQDASLYIFALLIANNVFKIADLFTFHQRFALMNLFFGLCMLYFRFFKKRDLAAPLICAFFINFIVFWFRC